MARLLNRLLKVCLRVKMLNRHVSRVISSAAQRRNLNFNLNEDSLALQDMARKFAREEMLPKAAEHDKTCEYPQEIFTKAWELGLGMSW